MFYLLVVGSRSFADYKRLEAVLDHVLSPVVAVHEEIMIVQGGAKGADALAKRYASERKYACVEFPANWDRDGKSAGYRRNELMHAFIAQFPSRGVVAFWDGSSKGTEHSFKLAESFKNPLRIVRFDSAGSSEPAELISKGEEKMEFRDKYWFLSNFYPCKVHFGGLEFNCVEAAFQSAKCKNAQDRQMFVGLNGAEAKRLGRKVELRADWDKVKDDVMFALVSEKFENASLAFNLKNITCDIVENNYWNDTYWGVCNGKGLNKLGKILMKVRDSIDSEKVNQAVRDAYMIAKASR